MDDGFGFGELRGVVLLYCVEALQKKAVPAVAAAVTLTPTSIAELSRAATEAVLAGDLSSLEGMALGGDKVYEPELVFKKAKAVLASTAAEWVESGRISSVIPANAASADPAAAASEGAAAATTTTTAAAAAAVAAPAPGLLPRFVDVASEQGRRPKMEDRHVAFVDLNALLGRSDLPPQSFFGVYDGHGGIEAAQYAQAQLHLNIAREEAFASDPVAALHAGFLATDAAFLAKAEREAFTSGATACCVLIRGSNLYVAWLGDSQAMMCKKGDSVDLMNPHKPQREDEKARIEQAGGVVVWFGAWRVNGVLSVARAFGDRKLKQWVIGVPDVKAFELDGTEDFVLIGCDGLWDVMDGAKVVAFVSAWRQSHPTATGIAQALVTHCIDDLSSTDNISVIFVFFTNDGLAPVVVDRA